MTVKCHYDMIQRIPKPMDGKILQEKFFFCEIFSQFFRYFHQIGDSLLKIKQTSIGTGSVPEGDQFRSR